MCCVGSDEEFEASKAILESMGANIVHCGGNGNGKGWGGVQQGRVQTCAL